MPGTRFGVATKQHLRWYSPHADSMFVKNEQLVAISAPFKQELGGQSSNRPQGSALPPPLSLWAKSKYGVSLSRQDGSV